MRRIAPFFIFLLLFSACDDGSDELRLGDVRLQRFSSCQEIEKALTVEPQAYREYEVAFDETVSLSAPDGAEASDSVGETNVQVSGVDELDRAKAMGDFIYRLSTERAGSLVVLRRAPTSEAGVIQTLSLEGKGHGGGLFVTERQVIAMSQDYEVGVTLEFFKRLSNGKLEKTSQRSIEGGLQTGRMIGDRIHLVLSSYLPLIYDEVPGSQVPPSVPISESLPQTEFESGETPLTACRQIYHEPAAIRDYDWPRISNLLCVASVNINEPQREPSGECLVGDYGSMVYASLKNLYVATGGWERQAPIHQFSLETDEKPTSYVGSALIQGQVLNQFSMDEYDGHFRVATTLRNVTNDINVSSKSNTSNEVTVFELVQGDPELSGRIENIAPGERIYSARFMGERGYVVTFKKVDPLFSLDLRDPKHPKIRGELKIPGYSSYLHPMQDGYLLAVGKDAEAAQESDDFAWYQGMAMSIFDVRDIENPKLLHKIGIGSRGTESEALYDHKAFRYIPEKGLVLFPISLYEGGGGQFDRGELTFTGYHLYHASLAQGFHLAGTSAYPEDSNSYEWYRAQGRSFYRDGMISMIGGGELVLRSASAPDQDLARKPAE